MNGGDPLKAEDLRLIHAYWRAANYVESVSPDAVALPPDLGDCAELLQRLAHVYIGPEVKFPRMTNPPPGHVIRIEPRRFSGNGPWLEG